MRPKLLTMWVIVSPQGKRIPETISPRKRMSIEAVVLDVRWGKHGRKFRDLSKKKIWEELRKRGFWVTRTEILLRNED